MKRIALVMSAAMLITSIGIGDGLAATTKKKKKQPTTTTAQIWEACRQMVKRNHGAPYKVIRVQRLSDGKINCWYSY